LKKPAPFHDAEMQMMAARYLSSAHGIGTDEKLLFHILEKVGRHPEKRDAFNRALKSLDPTINDALDIAHREFGGSGLKRTLFQAKLERSKQLYLNGKETQSPLSDWHYRMEGAMGIPLGLFDAFKKHFFTCAGTLAGIALFASFVPYLAAQLSNIITLMSAALVVKSELKARQHPKGSIERQEALKESGEGLTGVGINFIPLASVTEHLSHGRQAIKAVANGSKTLKDIGQHADDAAVATEKAAPLLQKMGTMVKSIPGHITGAIAGLGEALKESTIATPKFIKENMETAVDVVKTTGRAATNPVKFATQELPKGVQAGLAYDSSLPTTLHELKASKNPGQFMQTAAKALSGQAVLAMTLIDEILFPMVKILQSATGGKTESKK
jgi:hypothetical protein